uniref:Uncharacterized protein n=1 Tax=Arundo donax TaxID=35708 RepID=A0A0A9E390_ARUDO
MVVPEPRRDGGWRRLSRKEWSGTGAPRSCFFCAAPVAVANGVDTRDDDIFDYLHKSIEKHTH